jgi:hypothetical protein
MASKEVPIDRTSNGPMEIISFINYSLSRISLTYDMRMLNAIINSKEGDHYGMVYLAKPGKEKDSAVLQAFADASNAMGQSDI